MDKRTVRLNVCIIACIFYCTLLLLLGIIIQSIILLNYGEINKINMFTSNLTRTKILILSSMFIYHSIIIHFMQLTIEILLIL